MSDNTSHLGARRLLPHFGDRYYTVNVKVGLEEGKDPQVKKMPLKRNIHIVS
jgi:hypothetical protein